jgi:hypothetical protein
VLQAHTVSTTAAIIFQGVTVREGLAVVSGSVTLDRTAASRGRCTLQLAEPFLIPTTLTGVLAPYGYEIAITSGIAYDDGTTERMALGVFPIQSTEIDGVSLLTSIEGVDRTQRVRDAKFIDDYAVAGSTLYTTAMQAILTAQTPELPALSFPTIAFTTPATGLVYQCGTDPFDALSDMAAACGCEIFFDGLGVPTVRPEPAFTNTPVWTISEGAGGALVSASLHLSRAEAFNAVVASGENSSAGVVYRAISTDNDPTSVTYYLGGFGRKPRFYTTPLITSTVMAQSAADALMQAMHGVARSIDLSALPNRALEPGDPVLIKRTSLNVNEIHLLDALTFDLSVGAMQATSRARAQQ